MTHKIIKGQNLELAVVTKTRKKKPTPQKFMEVMARLEQIDREIKKEEKTSDAKMAALELEKQYLWNIIQPK